MVGPGGWIVPESDPAALARLLETLAAAPAERAACAQAGLRNVAQNFTYDAVAGVLAQVWIAAVSEPGGRAAGIATPAPSVVAPR